MLRQGNMKLHSDQVVFHPLSDQDPAGRVFWWEGNLYRAISTERVPFYEQLLTVGIVQHLTQQELIVETEATDLELDGYGLVLKHRSVPFVSYCNEWCGEMLKAAALRVLQLERELLKYDLALEDPHPRNVLFVGPSPIWVDLGSLTPAGRVEPAYADEEFSAHYTRPLKIIAAGHARIARCLMRDGPFPRIEQRELDAIIGTGSADITRNAKAGAKFLAKKIVPTPLRPVARRAVQRLKHPLRAKAAPNLSASIENAVREIQDIHLVQPKTGWSEYDSLGFPDFDVTGSWTEKHRRILQILAAKRPVSVLDIGSNRGWYSQLAARNGANVASVDFDEPSVTKLFVDAVDSRLPILPLVMDFYSLTPPMPWNIRPDLAPAARLRCEMVFALSLVHHLVFAQYMNFERIVAGLSAVTEKWLVVEFMDPEDVGDYMDEWHGWYAFENFLTALSREFRLITHFPSDRKYRHLILCER
jgi:SAM-dependent methyltransferase